MTNGPASTCSTCNGTQFVDDELCPECLGQGSIPTRGGALSRRYLKEQLALPVNIFLSHVIWEATDQTEYQALDAGEKVNYNLIVHMGTVNLNEGSKSRAVLWNLFDSESTTRAALLAILE